MKSRNAEGLHSSPTSVQITSCAKSTDCAARTAKQAKAHTSRSPLHFAELIVKTPQ
jgi:hypothetical protein